MARWTTSRERPSTSRACSLRTTRTEGSAAAAATSWACSRAVPMRKDAAAAAGWSVMALEVQQVPAEAAVAVAGPYQPPAAEHGRQPVQDAVDRRGVHEPGEEEAVAAHLRPGLFEVVRDLLGCANDAVPGAA